MSMKHVSDGSFQAWATPRPLAAALVEEFDLVLDVAADTHNTVCPAFFDGSEGSDGLLSPWLAPGQGVWCNPPYADVPSWLSKASEEVLVLGNCVRAVLLVPAAVGVRWFTLACSIAEVNLFDQRIRFDPPPRELLSQELQQSLFKENGAPKSSPGGGNALLVIERGGLRGITGLRSAETGRLMIDFLDGQTYEP